MNTVANSCFHRLFAPLAQLDRALVYGTKGWGFDLLKARQKGEPSALLFYLGLI